HRKKGAHVPRSDRRFSKRSSRPVCRGALLVYRSTRQCSDSRGRACEQQCLLSCSASWGWTVIRDEISKESGLTALRDEAYRTATEHGLTHATVGEEIALMHSELSEALEDFRGGHAPSEMWYVDKASGEVSKSFREGWKPCGIPSEMADVVIRVLDFCGKH